ncbi:MAG: hypothetical protein IIY34_00680 [Clostridia bacterium]|nr:hypothetical protein [Clostridia bacterium]
MSDIAYRLINELAEEMDREYEEKMARLEAEERARTPWLFCTHNCYRCEKETFKSCKYTLKEDRNCHINPFPSHKSPKIILPWGK